MVDALGSKECRQSGRSSPTLRSELRPRATARRHCPGRLFSSVSPSRTCSHTPTRRQGPWLLPNPIKMTARINLTSVKRSAALVSCPAARTHTPGCQGENPDSRVKSLTEGSTRQREAHGGLACASERLITWLVGHRGEALGPVRVVGMGRPSALLCPF